MPTCVEHIFPGLDSQIVLNRDVGSEELPYQRLSPQKRVLEMHPFIRSHGKKYFRHVIWDGFNKRNSCLDFWQFGGCVFPHAVGLTGCFKTEVLTPSSWLLALQLVDRRFLDQLPGSAVSRGVVRLIWWMELKGLLLQLFGNWHRNFMKDRSCFFFHVFVRGGDGEGCFLWGPQTQL